MAVREFAQERWKLGELFPSLDSPELDEARAELNTWIDTFEGFRSLLADDLPNEKFNDILQAYDQLTRQVARLYAFGYLCFAGDTQDQSAQTYLAQVQQLVAEVENKSLFFNLWWKELGDEPAQRLMDGADDYRYWLEALRLEKPYTLSEPEEKIINLKNVNGAQMLVRLYDSITNRYVFKVEVDGEVQELTREELLPLVMGTDPDLRAAAYKEQMRVYGSDAPILGQIYQARARDWRSEKVGLRGFSDPISVRNLANDIPDEIVDTLLEVCRSNAPLFQRYFKLKARWLGVEKLRRFDLYAPVGKVDVEIDFQRGAELVLESLAGFEPRFAQLARRVFEQGHLDGEVRKGKMGGAFCLTVSPDYTPWVLASYTGRPNDVATLAHELGHAIHSMLSEHHTALTQQSNLPLAETASTFAEMLLVDRMLEEDPDPAVQHDLLFRQMDDAYATIMRQAYFAIFERTAHKHIHEGASINRLAELYMENLQEQFGDSMELSDDFKNEWVAVPHFLHAPFYVYAYAFGQLLVLSLYQRYRQEGDSFKPSYIELLSAGGALAPIEILKNAGVDVSQASFWQGGFDVLERALEQLEAIELAT